MAVKLNKNRMFLSRLLMLVLVFIGLFCATLFREGSFFHETLEIIGYILVCLCALGRVYASAFIGGKKNTSLITGGPYSLCRNPLYFFSFLGIVGVAAITTSLIAILVAVIGIWFLYDRLIAREEQFLREKFGTAFEAFTQSTPRFFPSFKSYTCPDEIPLQPKFLLFAVIDAVWWFVPYPVFELADHLREAGILTLSFYIP